MFLHVKLIVAALLIFLTGCSANHYSIHRKDKFDSDSSAVISIDAKQRLLISNVVSTPTEPLTEAPATDSVAPSKSTDAARSTESQPEVPADSASLSKTKNTVIQKIRRYCAEPSPDVFSVLSQAASASGSFGQSADTKSINAALQAAYSSSEGGATIARTQTINMLKEMMYRTCERYLNGQIDDFEYPVIAARDQRVMISILAIEQLTGTVMPKPIVIAATGSSSTVQSSSDAILALENANKKVAEKKSAFDTAKTEFAEVDKPKGSCEQLMLKKPGEVTDEADVTKLNSCNEKKRNLDEAETDLKEAKNHYEALANLSGKLVGPSATAGTTLLSSSAKTELDVQADKQNSDAVQGVANVVKSIVDNSFKQDDETSFFCYSVLRQNSNTSVSESCTKFLLEKVKNESSKLKLNTIETENKIINLIGPMKNGSYK